MLKLMAPLTVNDDRQKPIHAEDKKTSMTNLSTMIRSEIY